jgi:hypothetical protein
VTQVYTYLDRGDYIELSEDDVEKTIAEITARIAEFETEKDKIAVDKYLNRMVKDGLLRFDSEKSEYILTTY